MARDKVTSSEARIARRLKRIRAFLRKHSVSRTNRAYLEQVLAFVVPLLDKLAFTVYEDEKELWFLHGRSRENQEEHRPLLQITMSVRVARDRATRLNVSLYSKIDEEHAVVVWKAREKGCAWESQLPEEQLRDFAFCRAVDELRQREKPGYKDATARRNIRFFVRTVLEQDDKKEQQSLKKPRRANKKPRRS